MSTSLECSVPQLCDTVCNSTDSSPQGSAAHGIIPARLLNWAAISSARDLPNTKIEPESPVAPELAGSFFNNDPPGEHQYLIPPSIFFQMSQVKKVSSSKDGFIVGNMTVTSDSKKKKSNK